MTAELQSRHSTRIPLWRSWSVHTFPPSRSPDKPDRFRRRGRPLQRKTMHPLTGQLAAVVASTDAVPRLVRQFTALFLVTPQGDVWRIFDSDEVSGNTRFSPAN